MFVVDPVSQAEQAVAAVKLYSSAGQSVQNADPAAAEKVPAAQS